ncbi:tetratricopeptide repeat protein [Alteromonas sp. ASW11-19]|uniref:non-specific serine/threonine protein kinase n=1 Tax=Alteromonas salexigens TaxID=2982530 RepID=A0ABT2VKD9_9ALTE|nr:serine/threonine-protein kinase [Alteromonas salexigens]MCU7553669.1 tetratricopeptide repeat protein [Alteromonas salexigens]
MTGQSHSSENADELSTQQLHSAHRLAANTLLAGRFRVISQLGAGSQASVYAAHDTLLEVDIALKLIDGTPTDPQHLQGVRNEVVLARKLQHPNIVRVHDVFADDEHVFFTMAYVEGVPLYERLLQPISRTHYRRWSEQLLDALHACHQAGVRHGDIKPDNILIDTDDNLLLIDFGIGRAAQSSGDTQTSGHAAYSAPEVLQTGTPTDTSDTYSAGKVLGDMLGAVANARFSLSDTLWRRRQQRFIAKLTQTNPTARPDIAEAADALRNTPSPRLFSIVAAAGVVAVLVIATVLVVRQPGEQAPALPDRTLQVVMVHDPAFPLLGTMADILYGPLATEPELAIIPPEQAERLVENLAIQPWEVSAERADMAASLGVDVVVVLDAVPTGSRAYLMRGTARFMPVDKTLVDVTHEVQTATLDADIQQFAEKLVAALYDELEVDSPQPNLAYMAALRGTDSQSAPDLASTVTALQEEYPEYPGGWLEGAQIAWEDGNLLKAREYLDVLFSLQPESDYWHLQGQLIRAQMNDDLALAQQAADSLIAQYPDRPRLLATRAAIHEWANNSEQAMADYQQALTLSPHNGQYWFELARLEIINGDIEYAIDEPLTKALVAFRKAGDRRGEGLVLNAFGVAHLRLSDYAVAQRYFTDALAIRDADTSPSDRATTLANLANVAAINGEFTVAEDALSEASDLLQAIGDRARLAHVLDTLGFLYEERGRYQKALGFYKRGLDIRVQEDDNAKQAESMSNVAYMHFLTGDFSLAEIYWQQAINQFEKLNDQAHLLRTWQNMAQLSLVKGDNRAATRLLSKVADALTTEQTQEQMYNSLLFSYLHFNEGRLDDAGKHMQNARKLADDSNDSRAWVAITLWQTEMCVMTADWQCVESQLPRLQQEVTPDMLEAYAVLGWLTTAYRLETTSADQVSVDEYLTTLSDLSIPVVTELQIKLDLLERMPALADTDVMQGVGDKVAPRYYQAYLQWLYLQALAGEQQDTLTQQLAAHPDYWRNHLYYQAVEADEGQARQQQLTESWLSQLTENQAEQYRQTYLEQQ